MGGSVVGLMWHSAKLPLISIFPSTCGGGCMVDHRKMCFTGFCRILFQSTLRKRISRRMVDAMSIDPSDLGIEEFETLETIQAELERLDEERNHEGKVIIAASRNRVVMANEGHTTSINIVKLESNGSIGINEGGDIMVEKMEEDEEEEHSGEDTSMMMMMDDQGGSGEDQLEDGVGRRFTVFATHEEYNGQESPESSGHFIFSETVVGEEIIEDEQVIKEEVFSGNEPRIYDDVESMSQEEVVSEIGIEMKESNSKCEELEESIIKDEYEDQLGITSVDMEEVTSDNVLSEETVIGEVQEEEEEDIDEPPLPTTMVLGPAHQPMVVTKQQPQVATTLVLKTESMVPNSGVGAPGVVTMSTPQLHSQPQQITVVGSSSKLGPNPPPGVYVVATTSTSNNLIGAQSILQAGTILSQKDSGKVTRMIVSSGGGGGEVTQAPQTIRIIGSQGKLLGSPAKTITLAQAKQMGLITSANQHILPAAHANKTGTVGKVLVSGTKKTVTVMKSPTKILPAPSPSLQHQQQQVVSGAQPIGKTQKVLIRQANTLKAGTILAGGGQSFIRIPTSQTLNAAGNIHQIHIPGKQVQYVKLVGAGGGGTAVVAANPTGQKVTGTVTSSAASSTATTTFVPVSAITKSIPVALPTSVLNSSQTHSPVSQQPTFKVVPIQQQQSSAQGNIITTPTHRVLIPASAVKAASSVSGATSGGMVGGITSVNQSAGGQQSGGVVSTGASPTVTTVSNIVMLPSHLIHQVKKVPLLGVLQDNKMTVTSASGLLGTTVNSGGSVVGSTSQRRPPGSPLSVATSGPTPVLAKVVTTTSAAPSIKQKDSPVGVLSSGTSPSSVVSSPPSPSLSVPSSSASPPSTFNMAGSEIGASKVAQQPQVAAAILSNGSNNGVSSLLKAAPPSDSYHSHHNSSAKTENCWSGDESSIISTLEANGIRPRKPCNCTKSMCLKLYCDCFANGEFCHQCNCTCCYNNLEHEEERQRAIKSCLERNPTAFRPKIGKSFVGSDERRHNKGCNCRRSGCLKNYCECYEAKIPCSKNCKCVGCKNVEGYLGRRSGQGGSGVSHEQVDEKVGVGCGGLGGVGGTGGGAVLGLGAGGGSGLGGISQRNKTSNNNYYPTQHLGRSPQESLAGQSNRQAFNLLSSEVVQATCQCMLAQAEDWEKNNRAVGGNEQDVAQTLIIEEFGRCIIQIIDCVTKSSQSSTNHHSSSVSGPGSSSHHHHHHHSSSHHHHHNHHHNRHNNHHTTTMS